MDEPFRFPIDRRTALTTATLGAAGALLSGPVHGQVRHPGIPRAQLGAINTNQVSTTDRFGRWLGRAPDHQMLYFNQSSWAEMERSISYIIGIGSQVLSQGRGVQWSIPVGGHGAYESVVRGQRDALYQHIAQSILATYQARRVGGRICIRLPWEFNLASQTLAARNASGAWDPRLYIRAYRRIAYIFKRTSPRFYYDWCPNIGREGHDPDRFYPGDDVVHVVSLDVYYVGRYDYQNRPDSGAAIYHYRRTQPFGLDWLSRFAFERNKLMGISEWGVDDNRATGFALLMTGWIKEQGGRLAHHNYWDRNEDIDTQISTGGLPAIGAVYRRAFGRI